MTLLRTLDLAATGMSVQRTRMNVASMNMANQNTTRTAEGGPYRRRDVVIEATALDAPKFANALEAEIGRDGDEEFLGVAVDEVLISDDDPVLIYDPGHPDADETGHVATPNVNGVEEMVNMLGAARAYEAGTTIMKTVRDMAEQALRIGR